MFSPAVQCASLMLCTILRSMDLAAAAGDDTDHKEGLIEVHVYLYLIDYN